MWFLGLKDSIGNAIQGAIRSFMFFICDFIYRGISYVYDIFARLASAEILSDTTVMAIYQRVGLVLGIFMVFKLSFTFIQIVINPDTISDKDKGAGGTILKAILVVVLLGTVPYMFSAAYEIQKAVIDDGIINRVVLGADAAQEEIDPGVDLAFNLIRGNYNVTSDASALNASSFDDADDVPKYLNGEEVNTYEACNAIVNEHNGNDPKLKWEMQNFGKMTYGKTCLNVMYEASDGTKQFLMDYDPLFCLIIGIFVLYMLVIYCLKAAERVVQLAFLQLIAPVPIMSYLSPKKDGLFDKWVKMCITTFLDIFIRTAVLSLTAALALIILSDDTGNVLYNTTGQPGGFKWFLIQALVIIGLFMFAKRVPELLGELFPSTGGKASLGGLFQSPKKAWEEVKAPFASTAKGIIGAGKAVGRVAGAPGRAIRRMGEIHEEGGTVRGAALAGLQRRLGVPTKADRDEKEMKKMQSAVDNYNAAKKEAESEVGKHESNYNYRGRSLGEWYQRSINQNLTDKEREDAKNFYGEGKKLAVEHAMSKGGAVKNGEVVFNSKGEGFEFADASGKFGYDSNATISANMEAVAVKTDTNPANIAATKAVVNEYQSTITREKSGAPGTTYQRNVANRDNAIGGGSGNKGDKK